MPIKLVFLFFLIILQKKSVYIFLWKKMQINKKHCSFRIEIKKFQIYLPLNSNKLSVSRPSKMLHLKQGCFVREPKKIISRKAIIIIAQMMLTEMVESLKVWGGKSAIWFVKFSKGEIQNYVDFFAKSTFKYSRTWWKGTFWSP